MQMYKREKIYKSDYDNLEIVYDFWYKTVFYILGVDYWKLSEIPILISQSKKNRKPIRVAT
jgi:hypothetical protein